MENARFYMTLDVDEAASQNTVNVRQGDNCRELVVSFSQSGRPYHPGEGCRAALAGTRPDGGVFFYDCTMEEGRILCVLNATVTAVPGRSRAEIRLYGENDALIASPAFSVYVAESAMDEGELVEGPEGGLLSKLIDEARQAIDECRATAINDVEVCLEENSGEPDASVELLEDEQRRFMRFSFSNLKGEAGAAFTYDMFTPEQLAALKGEKGETGPAGEQGEKGETGAAFTYDMFTPEQLAQLKGEKGEPGEKGETGEAGADFTYDMFTPEQLAFLKGEKGEPGPAGEKGEKGETGAAFTYDMFTPEQLAQLKGEKGEPGEKGETGEAGADFTYDMFTPEQLALLKGEKGETGVQGEKGEKGETGSTGENGKSAYQTALEWGFMGTEESFGSLLAGTGSHHSRHEEGGEDSLTVTGGMIAQGAVSRSFSAIIPASGWTCPEGAEYSVCALSIAELPEGGSAIWDVDFAPNQLVSEINASISAAAEWSKVVFAARAQGAVSFYATAAPSCDIPVKVEVILK